MEVIHLFEENTSEKLNWKFGPRRVGDVIEIYANAQKSKDLLSWTPKFTVSDAILHAWKWEKHLQKNG